MAAPPPKPPGVERDDEPQPLEKDCPADALTLYFYVVFYYYRYFDR